MGYGTENIVMKPDVLGLPYLSKVEGTLDDSDIARLKENGFINLGPRLTIHYVKDLHSNE